MLETMSALKHLTLSATISHELVMYLSMKDDYEDRYTLLNLETLTILDCNHVAGDNLIDLVDARNDSEGVKDLKSLVVKNCPLVTKHNEVQLNSRISVWDASFEIDIFDISRTIRKVSTSM